MVSSLSTCSRTTFISSLPDIAPVVRTSEVLRRLSNKVPALMKVADSLYVSSRRTV